MPSDRTIRWSAFGFAVLFGLVVVLGYIPGLNAPIHQHHAGADPGEHMLLGQYTISLLDDVTHGLTALLLLAAAAHSARASRLALTPGLSPPPASRLPLNLLRHRHGLRQRKIRLRLRRQNLGDRRLRWQLRRWWHRCPLDLHFLVPVHACAGRDEVTDDDVLLEPKQLVARAADSSVGQNSRRLLEARRRDERLRRQTGLRDSEKEGLRDCRDLLFLLGLVVRIPEGLLVDVLALEEFGFAALEHAHLLQHLPDDHANVLVVDLHTLQAVNLLHFVEQILLHCARPLDAKNVVRIHRTF